MRCRCVTGAGVRAAAPITRLRAAHRACAQSPSAAPSRATDKYSGSVALSWSPNGRYLAAIDSRRIITVRAISRGGGVVAGEVFAISPPLCQVWDMITPALDPVTRAPIMLAGAAAAAPGATTGAGEPAVALHAFLASYALDADEARDEAPSKVVHNAAPRPTAMHWHASGEAVLVADSGGGVRGAVLSALHRSGDPVRPLASQPAWPLLVHKVREPPPGPCAPCAVRSHLCCPAPPSALRPRSSSLPSRRPRPQLGPHPQRGRRTAASPRRAGGPWAEPTATARQQSRQMTTGGVHPGRPTTPQDPRRPRLLRAGAGSSLAPTRATQQQTPPS